MLTLNNNKPLGAQFKSYELNGAINTYLLDPFQYKITKFNYSAVPSGDDNPVYGTLLNKSTFGKIVTTNKGLEYSGTDFDTLLPEYTSVKKSAKDIKALSYHQFLANDGYFNPNEASDNSDLWYYGADNNMKTNQGFSGPTLNQQDPTHIIFPEPQRGGLGTRNLVKYSSANNPGNTNNTNVNNLQNTCTNFNWNTKDNAQNNFGEVYKYDSNYIRNLGISSLKSGTLPE